MATKKEFKKEKTNANKVPATIFIGCGGIGSDIVKKVAELCQPGEEENLRFVVMDTNVNDLTTVKDSKAVITAIQTSSTQSVGDYLKSDSNAKDVWFPCNATLYDKTVSEGAGQVRAISRLAVNATVTTGRITELYKQIDNLFLKDGKELSQALRVVIVSSACGGTGSGIGMVIGMLVRNYLHKHYREKACVIRGFLILPGVMDTVIKSQSERESLRRNGYATIKEINAFMMRASGFCDVRKELERFKGLEVEMPNTSGELETLNCLPFDFCFLLDRVNKNQENLETLSQYKDFAALSVYEQNIGPMQKDAFSMEDNIIKMFADKDNLGRNRFGGIGASVLRYPYEDVADYVAYSRALSRIGESASADWSKYDKEYKIRKAEFKRKKATSTEKEPSIGDVYMESLANDQSRFALDIRMSLADDPDNIFNEVSESAENYLKELDAEILRVFLEQPEVSAINTRFVKLGKSIDYESKEEERGQAHDDLDRIRRYESAVNRTARKVAKARARALFHTAQSIKGEDINPYFIESILKTHDGGMHPNAMRYILYVVEKLMNERYEMAQSEYDKYHKVIERYSSNYEDVDYFDVKARFSKDVEERCVDDVVALEDKGDSVIKKEAFWAELNKHFPAYAKAVAKCRDALLQEQTYDIGIKYIKQLNKEFEDFYMSFEQKVSELKRLKSDIVDKLKYHKGDIIRNICASERMLKMLLERCPESSDGLLLPGDLCSDIFEFAKKNAEYRRESALDPFIPNTSVNLFDDVLLDYFREEAREGSAKSTINMNVIKAIDMECFFNRFFTENALKNEGDDIVVPVLTDTEKEAYRNSLIKFGSNLATPGISSAGFEEPREVSCCAVSKALEEMKEVNIKALFERNSFSPVITDTVSKYEIRFFNALYNISPDKLSRFKCVMNDDYEMIEEDDDTGIYFKAYQKFTKNIGPDSTKSSIISCHIDKRWDTVINLPEISMDFQKQEMMNTHSALVYGLIHEMIKTYPSSKHDHNKKIFKLEDEEGDLTTFVVSNNTECDEFYEVLDALYRDKASVTMIYSMAKDRRKFDQNKNHRFEETTFCKDMKRFKIGEGHDSPVSLFEIPLAYYNSLPSSKLDDNELSIMVDSVISVLRREIRSFEQEDEVNSYLCNLLEEQYKLLIENFNNDEYEEKFGIRKNTEISENHVINIVCRKISRLFKQYQVSDFETRIDNFRSMARGINE